MKFIEYGRVYTTRGTWSAGLLVKDFYAITLHDETTDKMHTFTACVNYSSRGYGRMVASPYSWLNNRMFDKHRNYMVRVADYRNNCVIPSLDGMIGKEFKNINHFIREYNKRAYKQYV